MKSKKSGIPVLSAILRIVIAIVLVFIFFAACSRVRNALSNEDDKVINSFNEFANGINDMSKETKSFEVEFKKGSAIMGFRTGGAALNWDCSNCGPTRAYLRPTNSECVGSACACLCLEGFSFASNFGKCPSALICKKLTKEIKEITILKSADNDFDPGGGAGSDTYWQNGFLFVNGVEEGASGVISLSPATMFVDNNNGVVSVCTSTMKKYNEIKFGNERCTTPP